MIIIRIPPNMTILKSMKIVTKIVKWYSTEIILVMSKKLQLNRCIFRMKTVGRVFFETLLIESVVIANSDFI